VTIATTVSGKFNLLAPATEDIDWLVVANGLGKICRFAGNTRGHYSVAEHSVRLADAIYRAGGDRGEQLQALVHDAHEVYCGDITRPMRRAIQSLSHDAWKIVMDIERRCQKAVFQKAGCDVTLTNRVDIFDTMLGDAEATLLLGCERPDVSQFVWESLTEGWWPIGWDFETASERWLGRLIALQNAA
jgi:hypothetical protein